MNRPCDHPQPWLLVDWGSIPEKFKCKQCSLVFTRESLMSNQKKNGSGVGPVVLGHPLPLTIGEKERLLCYSAGIIGSTLANPNNTFTAQQLTKTSIRAASQLIDTIFDDNKLNEVLRNEQAP